LTRTPLSRSKCQRQISFSTLPPTSVGWLSVITRETSDLERSNWAEGRISREEPLPSPRGGSLPFQKRDSDTTFKSKCQRSRSPGRFTQRGLNAKGSCSGQRGNVFGVVKYCYVQSARRRARRPRGRRGAGHIVSPRAQLVIFYYMFTCVSCFGSVVSRPTCQVIGYRKAPLMTPSLAMPILIFLGLSVLDLGPMYATDRRQTKASLNALAY